MGNNGRFFEKLVAIIQESYRDKPETEIISNAKLQSHTGGLREVDVLIRTVSNGIPVLIGVECKNFNKPVSASYIEAFVTKCDDIDIGVKVFVSKKGFQKEALATAKLHDVKLFNLEELSMPDVWNEIVPDKILVLEENLNIESISLLMFSDFPQNSAITTNDFKICDKENPDEFSLREFVDIQILYAKSAIFKPFLLKCQEMGITILNEKLSQTINFISKENEVVMIYNSKVYPIQSIKVNLQIWYETKEIYGSHLNSYKTPNSDNLKEILSIQHNAGVFSIVMDKNEDSPTCFSAPNSINHIYKLETLAVIPPKV